MTTDHRKDIKKVSESWTDPSTQKATDVERPVVQSAQAAYDVSYAGWRTEVAILVPLEDAKENRFPSVLFDMLEQELTRHFGGYTRVSGEFIGGWKSVDGRIIREPMVEYRAGLSSLTDLLNVFRTIDLVLVLFSQEAVYARMGWLADMLSRVDIPKWARREDWPAPTLIVVDGGE